MASGQSKGSLCKREVAVRKLILFVVAGALVAGPSMGQSPAPPEEPTPAARAVSQPAVVRQGTVIPVERFESPMVLELPLVFGRSGVLMSAFRTPEEQKRTRKFLCDGAFLYDLTLKAGKLSRGGDVDIDGKVTIGVEHGEDRRVDVLTEIVRGEEVLASSRIANLKVEEDERSSRPLVFQLKESLLSDPSTLKVRLTMDVRSPKQ